MLIFVDIQKYLFFISFTVADLRNIFCRRYKDFITRGNELLKGMVNLKMVQ